MKIEYNALQNGILKLSTGHSSPGATDKWANNKKENKTQPKL